MMMVVGKWIGMMQACNDSGDLIIGGEMLRLLKGVAFGFGFCRGRGAPSWRMCRRDLGECVDETLLQ